MEKRNILLFFIFLLSLQLSQAQQSTAYFDMDACTASPSNGTNQDFSEFTPVFTSDMGCDIMSIDNVYRVNPTVNSHSCTPGVNDSEGMCVSYDAGCDYNPGSDKSVLIDVTVTPGSSGIGSLSYLSFYEKSNPEYDWIGGNSGDNNYPTQFAVRVLKDGAEIYAQSGIATNIEWTQVDFDFADNPEFTVTEETVFNIEMLAYCPVGNGALISVWDVDEITITASCCETETDGGTLEGGPFEFCVGDGEDDNIADDEVTVTGAEGTNFQWVITDSDGTILGLPPTISAVNFDGAGYGTCLIWHLAFEDGLIGAEMGNNAADLEGCFDLSNPIEVVRNQPDGGTLEGGPFEFCVGDGEADFIPTGAITVTPGIGSNTTMVITDSDGTILGLPPTVTAIYDNVNFDGAGNGTCLIWRLAYEDISGLEMGMNANDLEGCFDLSNPLEVIRNQPDGGSLEGGPFEFCVGDGEVDNIADDEVTVSGAVGSNFQWVITDSDGTILGLPPTISAVDFDGAGYGTCLIWHLSFEDGLMGAEMGMNAADLEGCFDLSNPIEVIRNQPDGGVLEGGPFEFCVGDGEDDFIPAGAITVTPGIGSNTTMVITDSDGTILGLPPTVTAIYDNVNFDGAGYGTCLIWRLAYEDISGLEMGMNANDLEGCFDLSNPIEVVRNQPDGGTLEGGPFAFCVGDGEEDFIPAGAITVTPGVGTNTTMVITDSDGTILGLPPTVTAIYDNVNFDGAGNGTCLIWRLAYEDISGLEMGMNANDLEGCFDLSNPIEVVRSQPDGGTLEGGPFEFCVGDGEADNIADDEVTVTGAVGSNFQWVITDSDGTILGLPPTISAVDFDGAGYGTCLIWHLSFEDGLMGAEMGMNADDLEGCFDLSNPIEVVRNQPDAGTLEGGPFEFCVGDGEEDFIPAGAITVTPGLGTNTTMVITDSDGTILGLPPTVTAIYDNVNFDGAGNGTCLIWRLAYEDISGLEMGMNANDLAGCFDLSNPLEVIRNQPDGGTLEGGPFEFCVGDGESDNIADDEVTVTGAVGSNFQWVITDADGTILGLPPSLNAVDFDGAGNGTCLIWYLAFEDGLMGAEMGSNAADLEGCFDLSNPIEVVRNQPDGGILEGGPFEFCVGDGEEDFIPAGAITVTPGVGTNTTMVITDSDGTILGLPPTVTAIYDNVNFDGAGNGTCLIWRLAYEDISGLEMGMNADDLEGCFDLSNPIEVIRNQPDGGMLEGGPFAFCVGDGEADNIPMGAITLSGNIGSNSQWVVTDEDGMILGLPPAYEAVDFDGAGPGTCLVWHLSFEDGLMGAEMGNNASDLEGCFNLSNPIEVVRLAGDDCQDLCMAEGGTLEGGPFEFCVGDGEADNIPEGAITLTGNMGSNSQWVVTDEDGMILGLPPAYEAVDFDGAGPGTCLVWHLSHEDDLTGAAVGNNASDLGGCFSLSNPIAVVRNQPNGGTLEGGPFEFCVGDGVADTIATGLITLTGNMGTNSQWVVTDEDGMILGLPPAYEAVNFDGAGPGTCLVWHLSFEDGLTGAELGNNASDLMGCFNLSNPISVVRNQPNGGTLEGGPFEFCVGDGVADTIATGLITLTGNSGTNSQWVVTDEDGMILGLPPAYEAVNFDGAGEGTCLVWHLSFEDGLTGAELGNNASDLMGCFNLSNPISVVRLTGDDCQDDCMAEGGTLEGGPFEFCVGDGEADNIPAGAITLTGNIGTNSQWVVTDEDGMILGLPPAYEAVDFDGAGPGTCLVWHLSHEDDLTGAELGNNASDLGGCFSLSNPISVVRNQPNGGTLEGGPFEFCVGDGVADTIATGLITLLGNSGTNSQWVVTDEDGMILGLPPAYEAVDFDGAGEGTCLVWHLSFEDGLTGAEVGNNASDLMGCFNLSNPISVVRLTGDDCQDDCMAEGGTLEGGPFEFCVGDGVSDTIATGLITLSGNSGTNSQWVVTDEDGMILGLPPAYEAVDFDGAGPGTCLVWHLSHEDDLTGAELGNNASDLGGCFSLSNPISVVRNQPNGGTLEGGPFTFCVGDGEADNIATGDIVLTGNSGTNSQWVVTDQNGMILGLPPGYEEVDFDGAGEGTCLVWHLSFEDGLTGAEVGNNADDLMGCFSLSNPIEVVRVVGDDCDNLAPIIVINEINVSTEIELKNIGLAPQDLSGWWLCDFPSYVLMDDLIIVCGDDLILDPGEILVVQSGILLSSDDGEMGLYSDDSFGSSNSIVDYVEWGSTGHQRSSVAVAAGIWTTGDFVPDWTGSNSLEYSGEGDSSSEWTPGDGSLCDENLVSEGEDELLMSIYPNPTTENIHLEMSGRNRINATVMIYDMFGKRLRDFTALEIEGTQMLDVSDLRAGKYILMIQTANQVQSTSFVVVK